ncbi:MAG: ABC transporter substrate-binding protein, partial [Alphaproteobacteria bacterium]|nr:ABC transporter substrate-binding protein [Alphaproteobacteria bacterium]
VVSLSPHALADVYDDIKKVARSLGVEDRGSRLVSTMQRGLARVETLTKDQPRQRLAFIEWIEPLMSCGHWMPELVALAGGESIFGETGAYSPTLSWEQLADSDPDAIVIAPCGYEIDATLAEMDTLCDHPLWPCLRAVAEGRVYVADGNAFFNRPGPRLVATAEILAEVLHPAVCDFGHSGHAYQTFSGTTDRGDRA